MSCPKHSGQGTEFGCSYLARKLVKQHVDESVIDLQTDGCKQRQHSAGLSRCNKR